MALQTAQIGLASPDMPAKKPPAQGEKPQKERFIEAAQEAGVSEEAFEQALGKVAPPKKPKR